MPCHDPTPDLDAINTRKQLDRVTAMLCRACTMLTVDGAGFTRSDPEIAAWWADHKRWDDERRATD